MTTIEQELAAIGLPPPDEQWVERYKNSVKNPLPSKAKIGDHYENQCGWQRRYIVSIEGRHCSYQCYYVEDYSLGNSSIRQADGTWKKRPPCSGIWIPSYEPQYCTLAHIRNWSQK